jgi:mannitol-specific phosphotransferase system IIBC component
VVAGSQATAPGVSAGQVGGTGSGAVAPAVPGVVDSGLATDATGSSAMLLATVLVGFGVMLMTAAGLLGLGGRRRSANVA